MVLIFQLIYIKFLAWVIYHSKNHTPPSPEDIFPPSALYQYVLLADHFWLWFYPVCFCCTHSPSVSPLAIIVHPFSFTFSFYFLSFFFPIFPQLLSAYIPPPPTPGGGGYFPILYILNLWSFGEQPGSLKIVYKPTVTVKLIKLKWNSGSGNNKLHYSASFSGGDCVCRLDVRDKASFVLQGARVCFRPSKSWRSKHSLGVCFAALPFLRWGNASVNRPRN
jgi:hypothetical protein